MRCLLISLLAVAVLPAAADAATVSRTGGTLRYAAGKGERISAEFVETSGPAFLVRRRRTSTSVSSRRRLPARPNPRGPLRGSGRHARGDLAEAGSEGFVCGARRSRHSRCRRFGGQELDILRTYADFTYDGGAAVTTWL